jgi:uncharacterized membrane protein required for colicin V production
MPLNMISLNEPFLMLIKLQLVIHFSFLRGVQFLEHLLDILLNVESMRRHNMIVQEQVNTHILLFVEQNLT